MCFNWQATHGSSLHLLISRPLSNVLPLSPPSQLGVQLQLQYHLREHVIQPDTATTDSDLETIHYEWSWDSNVLFPKYHTESFEAAMIHLQNLTAVSIDNINAAVATAMANSKTGNKTVQEYFDDLET